MHEEQDDAYRSFVLAHGAGLVRSAYLLTGDWHLAEDLAQTTLVKLYRAWAKVERAQVRTNYARTVLLRTWLDERRRPWRRAEAIGPLPDVPSPGSATERFGERQEVVAALMDLPPRQRAVLVLRYFDDLSVAECAAALRCAEGTVKSQAARGLATLRTRLGLREGANT